MLCCINWFIEYLFMNESGCWYFSNFFFYKNRFSSCVEKFGPFFKKKRVSKKYSIIETAPFFYKVWSVIQSICLIEFLHLKRYCICDWIIYVAHPIMRMEILTFFCFYMEKTSVGKILSSNRHYQRNVRYI